MDGLKKRLQILEQVLGIEHEFEECMATECSTCTFEECPLTQNRVAKLEREVHTYSRDLKFIKRVFEILVEDDPRLSSELLDQASVDSDREYVTKLLEEARSALETARESGLGVLEERLRGRVEKLEVELAKLEQHGEVNRC